MQRRTSARLVHVRPAYLDSLNPAQLQAVVHDPKIPLQILAGPGSGKTRVLTCRVAHLVEHNGLKPENICAVTFTNKAANEMKERLRKLIGDDRTLGLVMGTFHAICAKYLRTFGSRISLPSNFSICDANQSKQIILEFLRLPETIATIRATNLIIETSYITSTISKAKAKGISAQEFSELAAALPNHSYHSTIQRFIAEAYIAYTKELVASISLDFDDLLVYGVELLRAHPSVVRDLKHVLVDEFQDTNTMQYELMCLLSSSNKCVSIVGDPDQSIYGWRSAEVENLEKMQRQFAGTQQIFLEENYRSTGAILTASLEIIARDDARIDKSLFTSRGHGTTPTLYECGDEWREADVIADEIERLIAYGGGQLTYNDIAILLRINAISLHIEGAFRRHGIPCRILGGHRFFDRVEVKDLIAYLQLVDNPDFKPAFVRVVNSPKRGLGKKSIEELVKRAEQANTSSMRLAEAIVAGTAPDTKPSVKSKLTPFVKVIAVLRLESRKGKSAAGLMHRLIDLIKYEEHLKTDEGWEARWENVKQLITFASEIDEDGEPSSVATPGDDATGGRSTSDLEQMDVIDLTVEESNHAAETSTSPLRRFLEASMLSTDAQSSDEEADQPKVTVATCHAAKGLEWPVVMVPAVEDGTFPFHKSEDIAEERRLLYVACTRAQGLLYLTHVRQRTIAGNKKDRGTSRFIQEACRVRPDILTSEFPSLSLSDLKPIFDILGRDLPKEEEVDARVAKLGPQGWLASNPLRLHPESTGFSTFSQQDPSSTAKAAPPPATTPSASRSGPARPKPAGQTLSSASSNHGHVKYGTQIVASQVVSTLGGFSSSSPARPVVSPTPPVRVISSRSRRHSTPVQNRTATPSGVSIAPLRSQSSNQPPASKPKLAGSASQRKAVGAVSTQPVQSFRPSVAPQSISRKEQMGFGAGGSSVTSSATVQKLLPPVTTGNKRLGMRGPLKPFGAPKEKKARTE